MRSLFSWKSEAELAAVVVRCLVGAGWDVYQEVALSNFHAGRADIVAARGELTWVVETKLAASFDLVGQARDWIHYASMVSVAVPSAHHRNRGRGVFMDLCRDLGLGVLEVRKIHDWEQSRYHADSDLDREMSILVWPRLRRVPKADRRGATLRSRLLEEHKTFAPAGNAAGAFWSPWRATLKAAEVAVRANPGCTLKELVSGLTHNHYQAERTARACIARDIIAGRVPALRVDTDRKPWRVHLTEVK